ncbi:MAG TPA: citrate (Si)-synthase, eukaryotic [Flavobacteriales bacterium]|nr:citrate (Si)-synthase, eukaryotic [Flavobacteriales bacterium]HPH80969.1 citrate (Si)-synthase, eukaryotic [Flavobacteriales bacterium]
MPSSLKQKFSEKNSALAANLKSTMAEYGTLKIGEITLGQVYSGMKGMIGMITETSKLDPEEGIRFRGLSIPELRDKLPKAPGGNEPLPEGIFYLMLTGEVPTDFQVRELSADWESRSQVPEHVFKMLDALPIYTHPMTQFSAAVLAMRTDSVFAHEYEKGINKKDYWDPMFEDSMNLIARLPRVASYIYRRTYHNNVQIEPLKGADWSANFAHMMGYDSHEVAELMRLYLTIHADHEGGNVSAHSTHLVGSALSDAYYSFSAGLNGLAGPLHGLANQEVIRWILELQKDLGGGLPTKEQIEQYVNKTLAEGKVVPGYGHAVLRKTDPRFIAQMEFAKKYMPDDDIVNIVWRVYEVVPEILGSIKKIQNPWPNVDAHSGALLIHYGIKEYDFFTALFGVSRALGVLAQLTISRAMGLPIERPGSITTDWIKAKIASSQVNS